MTMMRATTMATMPIGRVMIVLLAPAIVRVLVMACSLVASYLFITIQATSIIITLVCGAGNIVNIPSVLSFLPDASSAAKGNGFDILYTSIRQPS